MNEETKKILEEMIEAEGLVVTPQELLEEEAAAVEQVFRMLSMLGTPAHVQFAFGRVVEHLSVFSLTSGKTEQETANARANRVLGTAMADIVIGTLDVGLAALESTNSPGGEA